MGVEAVRKLCTVKAKIVEETPEDNDVMQFYIKACRWPHKSLFPFEFDYPVEFLQHFGYEYIGEFYTELLERAIGAKLLKEYELRGLEYRNEKKDAAFSILYYLDGGVQGWTMKIPVMEGEDPSVTMLRFKERLEFATGLEIDMDRLKFAPEDPNSSLSKEEIVTQAIQSEVLFKTLPHPDHLQGSSLSFVNVFSSIARNIDINESSYFPLIFRFRIWTTVWGTARLVRELLKVNPDMIEKACSMGVGEGVFDKVLNCKIPSSPATEQIPLELLESMCLVRGSIAFMHVNGLISNDAGYDLKVKDVYNVQTCINFP